MFNKILKNNKQELLWIFTAALAFRLIWFVSVFFLNPEGVYFFDSNGYIELAQNILSQGEFGRFSEGYFYKEHFRTPGYPLLISLFLFVFQKIEPLVFFQVLISAAAPVLLFLISMQLGLSKKAAVIAAALLVIDFPSILFANTVLTDTFFIFVLLFSVWLLLLSNENDNLLLIAFSAMAIGFAVLIRPIGIFLPLLLILFIRFKFKLKTLLKISLFFSLTFILIFSWIYRNNSIFEFKFLSTVSNVNLLHFRAAEVYSQKNNITVQEARVVLEKQLVEELEEFKIADYNENIKIGFEISDNIAKKIIMENPLLFLKLSAKHVMYLLIKPARSYIDYQLGYKIKPFQTGIKTFADQSSIPAILLTVFQALILIFTWIGFISGIYYLIKEKNYKVLLPLVLIILYFIVASAGPEADARFRIPFMPFVFIVAASLIDTAKLKLE
ncbi:MAG: glycosyltransferase family 39 protein [Bacteroidota bacterium]|nr:glycosyltransferase family 39 protein [Bacteroidota bacterium]